jgi:hypothetical protein
MPRQFAYRKETRSWPLPYIIVGQTLECLGHLKIAEV